MLKRGTLLVLFVVCVVWAYGAYIPRTQAAQLAEEFLRQRGLVGSGDSPSLARGGAGSAAMGGSVGLGRVGASVVLTPLETLSADYHIFNVGRGNGFVIVAGDDAAPEPVLGYGDEGAIDLAHLPCGLAQLLDGYAEQIQWQREHGADGAATARWRADGAVSSPRRVSVVVGAAISPLLKTHWHQNNPYNMQTPTGYSGSTAYKCACGCLAVAMAQVLSVYRSPAAVTQTIPGYANKTTWKSTSGTVTATLPAVTKGTKIDWDNMLDNYSGSETVVQQQAVSKLMLYCGMSVETDYDASSAAVTRKSASALKSYFGYGQTTYHESEDYTSTQWQTLVYSELAAGRPVIMAGQTSQNLQAAQGHAFVCDGYDGQGKFHINWGWNNGSDGYYLLSALNPPLQGTGGANAGFNYYQEVIAGIVPDGYQSSTDTPSPTTPLTDAEISALAKELSDMSAQVQTELAACNQYYSQFLTLKETADNLQDISDRMMVMIGTLKEQAMRDDVDEYYYLLLEGCEVAMNSQVLPKLSNARLQIDQALAFSQESVQQLTQLQATVKSLSQRVNLISTRDAYASLQEETASARTSLTDLSASTFLSAQYVQQVRELSDVVNLQQQVLDYYEQAETGLKASLVSLGAESVDPSAGGNQPVECYDAAGRRVSPTSVRRKGSLTIERQKDGKTRKRLNVGR